MALPHSLVIISTTTKSITDLLLEIKYAAENLFIIVDSVAKYRVKILMNNID